MERYIKLNSEDLGASNLRYVLHLMVMHNVIDLESLRLKEEKFRETLRGELLLPVFPKDYTEGSYTIDIPVLGYRLTDVILIPLAEYYDRKIMSLVGFSIEKIYHIVNYSHSDKHLCFWKDDKIGFTFDLFSAGCFPESVVRSNMGQYHNGTDSTAVQSNLFYSGDFPLYGRVDSFMPDSLKLAVESGVLSLKEMLP